MGTVSMLADNRKKNPNPIPSVPLVYVNLQIFPEEAPLLLDCSKSKLVELNAADKKNISYFAQESIQVYEDILKAIDSLTKMTLQDNKVKDLFCQDTRYQLKMHIYQLPYLNHFLKSINNDLQKTDMFKESQIITGVTARIEPFLSKHQAIIANFFKYTSSQRAELIRAAWENNLKKGGI